jgi:L,D-peptidoglycan transpeptidase YkuD (ErfK/YbiS/YcfS/YnhG family)
MVFTRRELGIALGLVAGGCSVFPAMGPSPMIDVTGRSGETTGTLRMGSFSAPCALGRSGILADKREGDGGTPAGIFPLRELRYRADHIAAAPATALPVCITKPGDGWCDAPKGPAYNTLVQLPYSADAENMWRNDERYDLVVVIGYNDRPVVPGAGSVIFLHVAHEEDGRLMPTAGCVALRRDDLLRVIADCSPSTEMRIRLIAQMRPKS